jgi:hypothetical protein
MQVRYYLDGVNDIKTIFVRVSRYGIKFSLKQMINANKWDAKKQRTKRDIELNRLLDNIELLLVDHFRQMIINNELPTKDSCIEYLNKNTSLFKSIEQVTNIFIDHANKLMKINAGTWAASYCTQFKSFINTFDKSYPRMTFDMFTSAFGKTYIGEQSNLYSTQTIAGRLKKLKYILEDAFIEGFHTNLAFKKYKLSVVAADKIYLNDSEIDLWITKAADLPDRLMNASYLFLFGCLTGLRYSDFKDVKSTKIYVSNVLYYRILSSKTNTFITFPASDQIDMILDMNLHSISNQKLNTYIKEAAQIIGINEVVYIKGIKYQKYDQIQTHTARRSYATNAVLQGVPISMIMSVTGHKTESQFRKYVRMNDIESAVQMHKFMN